MTFFKQFFNLYIDGFRNITPLGKKLWLIIGIKLFIMFAILKPFFFPKVLEEKFETKEQKSQYVSDILTKKVKFNNN